MSGVAVVLIALPVLVAGYAYAGYPLLLLAMGRRRNDEEGRVPEEWPAVSITLAAYNEARSIAATLDQLLAADYPADRLQIIVISDASTDGTDEIVRRYADRGVDLIRLPRRAGKTAAENASRGRIRGEIVVNTDATVRIAPDALKPLVAAFRDPTVGVASGRDVSVGRPDAQHNSGESGYVGYEMWVRDLETRAGGIVGASGCFYAARTALHGEIVPEALSRDFAAPLIAHENGFRSVSVRDAVCYVPRTASLRAEYRRKVRTMARGLDTLYYKRQLLNPLRHGRFAWMLVSHKLVRWLTPWAALAGVVGLLVLAGARPELRLWSGIALLAVAAVTAAAWRLPPNRRLPRPLALVAYTVLGLGAGLHAWVKALRRERNPIWEPTRR